MLFKGQSQLTLVKDFRLFTSNHKEIITEWRGDGRPEWVVGVGGWSGWGYQGVEAEEVITSYNSLQP